ncbi:MAG TPA: phosphate/phosphite/phosphonate ABC transporter substrate-binding protein [Candidatus Competibacter phosphatis]|nr:phosphate/phosphite/phosphonate ABC transporter substrate-binding protein [Candidatus Competibacter phosphatis]HMR02836.1 phosphate/phosphite/phosphonate ABC transporter substrate-binding protein [Candidatus Competibacter phosphatis]
MSFPSPVINNHFKGPYRMILVIAVGLLLWMTSVSGVQGASDDAVFALGIVNERANEPDFALAQYSKLRGYLNQHLQTVGIQVAPLVITRDIPEMADRLKAEEVDAVIEGVFLTLELEERGGHLQPALLAWRKGQREYHSVFFSRKDGPIAALADLLGHILVFEAPRSTSAYAAPKIFLKQKGFTLVPADQNIIPNDAIRYVFAGAEINQAYWVLYGKGDAGAFNDGDWERLPPPLREQLRIIAQTPPLLRWLFSFRQGVSPEIRKAVETVLLNMHEDPAGREALLAASNIKQFERLTVQDQDRLAAWRKALAPIENP